METFYYCSWETKTKNNSKRIYASKETTNIKDAIKFYKRKKENPKCKWITLWRKETYQPEEIENWNKPYSKDCFTIIAQIYK